MSEVFIFEDAIKDCQSYLFGFILSAIPNKEDAKDILQKTNFILCQKQNQFDPNKGTFLSWARQISKFQIMGHRTSHARSRICFCNELAETLMDEQFCDMEYRIKKRALRQCLVNLPPHQKFISELRYKQQLSLKEVALACNRPIGAVSATLHRIRQSIKTCIDFEYRQAELEIEKETYN